jgi:uncharacterized RDD family membrane protein YckC
VSASASPPPTIPARLAARLIDVIIVVLLNLALGQVIGFGFDWLVLGAAIILGYFAAGDTLFGATVGKRVLGLRVVTAEGLRPSPAQALRRELFVVVGAVPFVGPILALGIWVWMLLAIRSSPLGQGPHDTFAGSTRVVRG